MDRRPIGIFDSGFGGLTALKALRQLLPGEDLVYFADTGRMPYGPRPREELFRMARQNLDFLATFGVKAILAACGTVSSTAGSVLEDYPVPALGVLKPAVEAMAAVPGEGPLAVLATSASIRSGQFTAPLQSRCPGREVLGIACPEFVPLIEQGHIGRDDPVLADAVSRTLEPLREKKPGAVLLGCTHYGIIEEAIRRELGDVRLISAADCGAAALRDHLRESGTCADAGAGETRFFISCEPGAFEAFASRYLETGPVHAERVDPMEI